ncbi:MAG: uroporphyrinogen-III synthase [Gammaproteobacteria bacterium]|nr:uroporphyrinogen-III synthase [Gammaproteobacteria bacterium]
MNDLTVLVTRPREQSEKLALKIAELGGRPVVFPTLEIHSVEPAGGWGHLKNRLENADIVVFTSANAVREVFSHQINIPNRCEVAAIGTSTQQALSEAGILCDWVPMRDYRSEGLLELPVFQSVKNKKIIVLAGEGGREFLQDILSERGAHVEKVAVYKRLCPIQDVTLLKEFYSQNGSKIIISTSVESLENLLSLSKGFGQHFEIPLMVVSKRIAEIAQAKGFHTVLVADNASDGAILEEIARYLSSDSVIL